MIEDYKDFEEFKKEFKNTHKGNLKTLLSIYWANKPIWKSEFFWWSLLLSTIIQFTIILSDCELYDSIEFLSNQILNIMPDILGFNLGGYVLLIGLNSQNILNEITEPTEGSKFSLFQKQSSVFAFSILIQTISIVVGLSCLGVIQFGKNIILPPDLAYYINILGLQIISFISIYAILLIVQIVLNIFNFGQILHFFVRLPNLEKRLNDESENK